MPNDDETTQTSTTQTQLPSQDRRVSLSWFAIPSPVKRIFDRFPLTTYEPNLLPQSRSGPRDEHVLFIFTSKGDRYAARPSFNPTCLKWQAYLRFRHVPFTTSPTSNHAASTNALPFLLPASKDGREPPPVAASQLEKWTNENGRENSTGQMAKTDDMRHEAYTSLVEYRIRNAYLYTLYLRESNFEEIIQPRYVRSASTNTLVRIALSQSLRKSARLELAKQTTHINGEAIYRESASAFEALSELLGNEEFFFAATKPQLFDAAVFAYTNLLLDRNLSWQDARMSNDLKQWQNLVDHRERILRGYFETG